MLAWQICASAKTSATRLSGPHTASIPAGSRRRLAMIHSANGSFDGLSYGKTCRYYKVFERIDLQPGLFVMPFVKAISAPLSRFLILLAPLVLSAAPAFAQTKEAAIKNCRMKVG